MRNGDQPLKTYRIRVGCWETRVQARDTEEAIKLARQQLAREFPRLYDLIRNLTYTRFEIELAA